MDSAQDADHRISSLSSFPRRSLDVDALPKLLRLIEVDTVLLKVRHALLRIAFERQY